MQESDQTKSDFPVRGLTIMAIASTAIGIALGFRAVRRFGFWTVLLEPLKFQLRLIAYLAIGLILVFVVLLLIVNLIKLRKVSKVIVFVSYQHENEDLANEVSDAIRSSRLSPLLLHYKPREHDDVISEVQSNIRSAHVILAITSDYRGFFEAEIFAATTLEKPVILLARDDRFQTPATAYSGYPVLSIKALSDHNFQPLIELVNYAADSREAVKQAGRQALSSNFHFMLKLVGILIVFGSALTMLVSIVALVVLDLFRDSERGIAAYLLATNSIMFVLAVILVCRIFAGLSKTFYDNYKLRNVIRQRLKTKDLTNGVLSQLLAGRKSGQQILACLVSGPSSSHVAITT